MCVFCMSTYGFEYIYMLYVYVCTIRVIERLIVIIIINKFMNIIALRTKSSELYA